MSKQKASAVLKWVRRLDNCLDKMAPAASWHGHYLRKLIRLCNEAMERAIDRTIKKASYEDLELLLTNHKGDPLYDYACCKWEAELRRRDDTADPVIAELRSHLTSLLRDIETGLFSREMLLDTLQCAVGSVCFVAERPVEIVDLRRCEYGLYLKTEAWKSKRDRILEKYNGRCAVCNRDGPIDVHHRTYDRRGCENESDLIALCRSCHETFHKTGVVKTRRFKDRGFIR